ncbi:MAG TPA: hypothetical protein VJ994_01965, partial [Paracoccaceae bacterium]|nr:hypothetical protein [Paracoccaceae bacterium]
MSSTDFEASADTADGGASLSSEQLVEGPTPIFAATFDAAFGADVPDGTTWSADEGVDGAIAFDGDGRYYQADMDPSALNGLDAFTIVMRVKSDRIGTDGGVFSTEAVVDNGDDDFGLRFDAHGAVGGGSEVIKFSFSTTEGSTKYESASGATKAGEW